MIHWADFVSRLGDERQNELIGRDVTEIYALVNKGRMNSVVKTDLILETMSLSEILTEKESWRIIVGALRPDESKELCQVLRLANCADSYEALEACSPSTKPTQRNAILDFFLEVHAVEEPRKTPATSEEMSATYPLFEHQRKALSRLESKLEAPGDRAMLHMPTGSGKTRTAMNFVAMNLRQYENEVCIWIADTNELCTQAMEEFSKAWQSLGNREIEVRRLFGQSDSNLEDFRAGLLVASAQKLRSIMTKNQNVIYKLGERARLIVFDEAHHIVAPTYKEIVETLLALPNPPRLLGLSATPGRSWDDRDLDKGLSDFFNDQKVGLKIDGYNNPMDYLIDEGFLAKPTFDYLDVKSNLSQDQIRSVGAVFEIPPAILEQLGADKQRNLVILNRLLELTKFHKRILYFAPSLRNAKIMHQLLSAQKIRSYYVSGETSSRKRDDAVEAFRGSHEAVIVLCNFGLFTTGFDVPQVSAALIARPTKSLVLYSQMVGRAIRGIRAGGQAEATIVSVVDDGLPGFRNVGEAFLNWEDVWDDE